MTVLWYRLIFYNKLPCMQLCCLQWSATEFLDLSLCINFPLITSLYFGIVIQLKTLPESVILETTEYKCLKSQYSVLFNEAQQIKSYLDEARGLLQTTKTVHLRHIEQMEVRHWFVC